MKKAKNFASGISSTINSPLPTSLAGECKKAAKILNSFIDPGQGMVDKIIPENILANAQGLAIYTVLKAGFLFSGRAGSGIVVARLPEGGWSAPSAIVTGGIGAGGQIGAELTDFVLVLNTQQAVKTFCQVSNVTLGGNVSVAAGPIGRNAEASGSANLKTVAAIYSYSKTRGLFAGVSLEGSVIVSRGDANEKLYGRRVTANELLTGVVPPPPEADALYRALNAKFHTLGSQTYNRSIGDGTGERAIIGRSGTTFKSTHISAPGTLKQPPPIRQSGGYGAPMTAPPPNYQQQPPSYQQQNNTYNNSYGQDVKPPIQSNYNESPSYDTTNNNNFAYQAAAKRAPPPPPPSRRAVPAEPTARALYAFDGQQDGDLSFREGDIITIVQKTESQDDWWTGKVNGRQGIFPANYVQLQ
jgi:lipid-binding SYLF domain-containing protein